MYQNVTYLRSKNQVIVWDDKHGQLCIPYKKYAYKKNTHGRYTALDGTKLEKVTHWDDSDIERGLMYESDLSPEVRTLIDMYYESDDPSTNHNELYFDIEVSTEGGFSDGEAAWQPVTSIAMYDKTGDQSIVIVLDKKGLLKSYKKGNLKLEVVGSEEDLLMKFLNHWLEINPTIITGWNTDHFDIPYLYNRITKVLGRQYADSLSPVGEVTYSKYKNTYKIHGVSSLDYMRLYKLFSQNEEASYALDFISRKEIGRGKIEYEGTLDYLYKTDPEKFVKYNLNDVDLVVELDTKLKYLALARGICHKGHVPYEDVYMTTRYLDGACLTYMKRFGVVAPNKPVHQTSEDDDEEEELNEFEGAMVKQPTPGLYEWVFDEDMSSLYPSVIRTLNISPETKFGRIQEWDLIKDNFITNTPGNKKISIFTRTGKLIGLEESELLKFLLDNKYTISAIGVIYDTSHQGLVPSILETWMNERDEYRGLAKKYGKDGNAEMADFFDSRQYTMKIVNNSLYGALGAPGFRFHDLDNAESITLSGQAVIRKAMLTGNEWFIKKLNVEKDYVIYCDTDSAFFSAQPIIEMMQQKMGKEMSKTEKADITFKTSTAIENYINSVWDDFAKSMFNSEKHFLKIKQEYVAETGFWTSAKKRYAQKIVLEKGVSIFEKTNGAEEWKLDVKGIDVVRSNFPKTFREFMSGVLIDILNKVDKVEIDKKVSELRNSIREKDLYDILMPTSVKDIKSYQKKGQTTLSHHEKGTPIHVKSAINYNELLKHYKINHLEPIMPGSKIRWTYLRSNPFGLRTCALKGFEDPKEILDFVKEYIDYDKIFTSALEKKLQNFYDALNYGKIPSNNNINDFFSF